MVTNPFKFEDVFIGRTDAGERIYLTAELRYREGPAETVRHNPLTGYHELRITGLAVEPRRQLRNAYAAGQIVGELSKVTRPAPGLTEEDIRALVSIWKRWHLNGMRSLCFHQHEVWTEDKRYGHGRMLDLDAIGTCKEGYRAGSGWLVDILPEYAMDRTHQIFQWATGEAKR